MESSTISSIIQGRDTEREVCPLHVAYISHKGYQRRLYVGSDLSWWGVSPYKPTISVVSPHSKLQVSRASSRAVAGGLTLKSLANGLGTSPTRIYNST